MSEVEQMTEQQLEEALKKARAKNAASKRREQNKYLQAKDVTVRELIHQAGLVATILADFKHEVQERMNQAKEELENYKGLRANSKGGFSLTDTSDMFKVVRVRATEPHWDERSSKAIELIKDFLQDTVKKRDVKLYEILIGFISRNQNQDLEYAKVMELMQHRDKFDDQRWLTGLDLIQESYSVHMRAYGYEFKIRNTEGKWEPLCLSFSSADAIKIDKE